MKTDRSTSKKNARRAGLIYINAFDSGLIRTRNGNSFRYKTASGKIVKSTSTLKRIEQLVIPPAWKQVWICSSPKGHIQARGRDADGRLQSIYHPKWSQYTGQTKYNQLLKFAKLLPKIRRRVTRDLQKSKTTKDAVIAAIVRVLDIGHIRIGNVRYEKERKSYGATTLKRRHVDVRGIRVSLDFPGKSGQRSEVEFDSAPVAKIIRSCESLSGQYLFSYINEEGNVVAATSTDVNDYLDDIADADISAKDFRTFSGTCIALDALQKSYDDSTTTSRKKSIVRAVTAAAQSLGNTKAVCRSSYIHSGLLAAAENGKLTELLQSAKRSSKKNKSGYSKSEQILLTLLKNL